MNFIKIENFDNYEINENAEIRNINTQKILKPFNLHFIHLYKDEGQKYMKRYELNIIDLLLKHHYYQKGINKENFFIKHINGNLLNCSLQNIKLVSKIFVYGINADKTFNLYNVCDKKFLLNLKQIPIGINSYHLFKNYKNTQEDIIKFGEDFLLWNNELKEFNLKFNYTDYRNHKDAVINFIKKLCPKTLFKHEAINELEARWINNSPLSALLFCEKGTFTTYGYDLKSAYASIMKMDKFKIPTKQGSEYTIVKLPEKLKFGYYKVKIISDHKDIIKLFKFNKNNIYTNHHINYVRQLPKEYNIKIELIQEKNNCYLYRDQDLIDGETLFKKWFDKLIEIKNKYQKNKLVKHLLSSGWGCLSESNHKTFNEDDDELMNILGVDLNDDYDYQPDVMTKKCVIKSTKQPFKYNIRLKPFLKAFIVCIMGNIILKHDPSSIIRIHTDGFSTTKKLNFQIDGLLEDSKYTGKFKYKNIKKTETII
jgi:hypothetical protein